MNIGLQPQYPTIWWVDGVLIGIILLGIVTEVLLSAHLKRKAEQEADEIMKARAEWEQRVDGQRNEIALRRKIDVSQISVWDTDEPRFDMHVRSLNREPAPVGFIISTCAAIVLTFTMLATIVMCVPFNSKYYNFYVEKGTVSHVVSTITVGDDSVGAFTFKLGGDPKPYTMYDPRIKTLEGQKVSLLCTAGWNNQAADSWTCSLRDYTGSTR